MAGSVENPVQSFPSNSGTGSPGVQPNKERPLASRGGDQDLSSRDLNGHRRPEGLLEFRRAVTGSLFTLTIRVGASVDYMVWRAQLAIQGMSICWEETKPSSVRMGSSWGIPYVARLSDGLLSQCRPDSGSHGVCPVEPQYGVLSINPADAQGVQGAFKGFHHLLWGVGCRPAVTVTYANHIKLAAHPIKLVDWN